MDSEIADMFHEISVFGYLGVKSAIDTASEIGEGGRWVGEQITEFINSTGVKLEDVDVCYVAYDSIFQMARNDIIDLLDIDILNDTEEQVEVYGNYCCTSLDYTEEAQKELKKILKKIKDEDKTDAIEWLEREIE